MTSIRVGTTSAYTDTKFSVLTKLLCDFLKSRCSFVDYSNFRDMLPDIRDGKIDASIPDATFTPERTHWLDFSHPLFVSTNSYVVDGAEASFCVDPLNTFDRSVYILTVFSALLVGLFPVIFERLFGHRHKRWRCPHFGSLSVGEATSLFFEGMLVAFYAAEMKDAMTGVCKFSEEFSSDQLQDRIVNGTFNVLYTPITQGKSYLETTLGFQNRSVRGGFDRYAVRLDTDRLDDVFDCKSVLKRRAEGTRYLFVANTGLILEYLRDAIQRCCVEVYEIRDLPAELLGFALTKGFNRTLDISRAVDWLHGQGFVARAQRDVENLVLPRCDKEAQTAFADAPSTLDELEFAFIFLLSGFTVALGAFTVERLLRAYTSHYRGRWSVKEAHTPDS